VAYDFERGDTTDRIEVGTDIADNLPGESGFSGHAWVQLENEAASDYHSIAKITRADSAGSMVWFGADTTTGLWEFGGRAANADSWESKQHSSSYSTGTLYAVGGYVDLANDQCGCSVNGSLETGAATFSNTTFQSFTPVGNDMIGNLGASGSEQMDGLIEHVCWWNVVLTASEFAALGAGISPLFIRPNNIWGYWPLVRNALDAYWTVQHGTIFGAVATGGIAPVHTPRTKYFDLGGFSARRNLILDGLVAQSSPSNGWNDQRANIPASSVRKVSNKEVVVTLPALAGYSISADETVDTTLYARALKRGVDVVGPTFTLEAEGAGQTVERSAVDRLFASDSQSVETESGTPAPDLTTSTRYVEIKNYP
jgi:hypothetical protein